MEGWRGATPPAPTRRRRTCHTFRGPPSIACQACGAHSVCAWMTLRLAVTTCACARGRACRDDSFAVIGCARVACEARYAP